MTDSGSKTSHAVIVARSMKMPAVVGVRNLTKRVKNGDWAIVDGYDGVVILNPSESTLFRYGKIQEQKKSFETRLIEANRQPAVTLDGVGVSLMANIEKVEEVAQVKSYYAEGVGLFRTEYLFLNSARIPGEQEQFLAYKSVAEQLAPQPVIIRTLDLGGDKPMAGSADLFPKENNPFMGFRAIPVLPRASGYLQGPASRDPDGERAWQGADHVSHDQRQRGTAARQRRARRMQG